MDSRVSVADDYSFDFKLNGGQLYVDVGDGSQWRWSGGVGYSLRRSVWYQVAAVVQRIDPDGLCSTGRR